MFCMIAVVHFKMRTDANDIYRLFNIELMGNFIEICSSKATAQMQSGANRYSISLRVPVEHLYLCGCVRMSGIVSAFTPLVVLL